MTSILPLHALTATRDVQRVTATLGGLLYVDKPAGLTSHDVVARVRRAARSKRVGHAGTLDPFATGLLVIAVGTATRLLQFVQGEPKVYVAKIAFGAETDTDDATGRVTREASLPTMEAVATAITRLTGSILQVPPAYSAKHVEGRRAYELARRGTEVDLAAVPVVVHSWDMLEQSTAHVRVRITCGGGTYIRALARDLGRLSGGAAHCTALRRESSGPAHVIDAVTLDVLTPGAIADYSVLLRNPLEALGDMPRVLLDASQRKELAQGRSLHAPLVSSESREGMTSVAFIDEHDSVLGIGERVVIGATTRWQPRVVLDPTSLLNQA